MFNFRKFQESSSAPYPPQWGRTPLAIGFSATTFLLKAILELLIINDLCQLLLYIVLNINVSMMKNTIPDSIVAAISK